MHTSRLAQLAIAVAILAAALFAIVPLASKLDAMSSFAAFRLFGIGILLALLALPLGLVALFTTRASKGRAGRGLAWGACALALGVIGAVAVVAYPARHLPPINDITTDPGDPPQFAALAREGPNADRDMSYPGESFTSQQRAAYPDLAPIPFSGPPDQAFAAAKTAIESFGWKIVAADPSTGTIEATDTSRIFHFVDDIAVRIRPAHNGSRIDVRSKSREGKGDLGANAARIRRLRDAL